jgi:hypothetical protein
MKEEVIKPCPEHPYMEKLLTLRACNPRAWRTLSVAARLSALTYEAQRRRAKELEQK